MVASDQRTRARLARATVIVAALFVASRALGLLREMLIAARFGTSADYDAYVAAFRIPDLLFLVVMSGAFGSAFIPVYTELLTKRGRSVAWQLANVLLSFTLSAFLLTGVATFLTADLLVHTFVAPGLSPPAQDLAAGLTRVLILSPLFLGIGAAAKAMLEAESRFTEPAVAPLLYNLGIILGALVLAPLAGIYGLAYGVLLGAVAYTSIQLVSLYRSGWRFSFSLRRTVPGLSDVVSLLGPRLLAQAAMQINILIMTNLASRVGHQSIAALQYAYQLFLLPHGVVALSLATVLFPTLAHYRSTGAFDRLAATFARSLRIALLVTLPLVVVFVFFARSIVQTLFQFGAFTASSTTLVSDALRWFAPGLIAYTVVELLTRLSYAFKDSRSPVIAALCAVGANLILGTVLARPLGHRGLALSLALATTLEMLVLAVLLRKHIAIHYPLVIIGLARALPALAVIALAALQFAPLLDRVTDPAYGRSFVQFLAFVYTLFALGASYLILALVCRQSDTVVIVRRLQAALPSPARNVLAVILGR